MRHVAEPRLVRTAYPANIAAPSGSSSERNVISRMS